jgi:hypothetical protein
MLAAVAASGLALIFVLAVAVLVATLRLSSATRRLRELDAERPPRA